MFVYLIGFLADYFGRLNMLAISMCISGIATLCWQIFTTFNFLLLYCVLFGFCGGGFISLLPTVCTEIYGTDNAATVMGLVNTSLSFGFLLSTPVAGWLYLIQQSYVIPICVSGSSMIIGSFIIVVLSFLQYVECNSGNGELIGMEMIKRLVGFRLDFVRAEEDNSIGNEDDQESQRTSMEELDVRLSITELDEDDIRSGREAVSSPDSTMELTWSGEYLEQEV